MITKEALLNASKLTKKGVLTFEEAVAYLNETRNLILIFKDNAFFFTDDLYFGTLILSNEWIRSPSLRFPIITAQCEDVEDGIIDTIGKFISVFCKNKYHIDNIDFLLEVLNVEPFK